MRIIDMMNTLTQLRARLKESERENAALGDSLARLTQGEAHVRGLVQDERDKLQLERDDLQAGLLTARAELARSVEELERTVSDLSRFLRFDLSIKCLDRSIAISNTSIYLVTAVEAERR
jgi:hypothetical protein